MPEGYDGVKTEKQQGSPAFRPWKEFTTRRSTNMMELRAL